MTEAVLYMPAGSPTRLTVLYMLWIRMATPCRTPTWAPSAQTTWDAVLIKQKKI